MRATVGCLLGHPSAIGFGVGAWLLRPRPAACIAVGLVAVLIPLFAFARGGDLLIAAGGHVGELAFATYCYTLAWTGGRPDTPRERTACTMAGARIQFANLKLCFGLMTSVAARDHYAHHGSLGLKNDYLVIAEDLLQWRLPSVALVMFVLALPPLPLGLLIGAWRERMAADQAACLRDGQRRSGWAARHAAIDAARCSRAGVVMP